MKLCPILKLKNAGSVAWRKACVRRGKLVIHNAFMQNPDWLLRPPTPLQYQGKSFVSLISTYY